MPINVSRPFAVSESRPRPFYYPTEQNVPKPILNLSELTKQLTTMLREELTAELPDLEADLVMLTQDIAPVLISAVAAGDTKLKDELIAQLEVIADIHKIRANAAVWRVVKRVVSVALSAVSIGLSAVTGAIK